MNRDETPYDELDPPVAGLCRAVNAFPGLRTGSSCGGHETGGLLPADRWQVAFSCELDDEDRPTLAAWLDLEFVAWAVYDLGKAERAVWLEAFSLPPWPNDPARMLSFDLHGERNGDGGIEPNEVAAFLDRVRRQFREGSSA